ncbi:MAG: hypothetical protein JXR83_05465, partial [Deltaproteobacteria bacterium]|nr:hypothetical protein [Deltaproteobacteria bacterium]
VLRRFLVVEAPSVEKGLARYEQVERVALPLYGRVVADFVRSSEGVVTVPEKMSPLEALKSELRSGELFAFDIFPVGPEPAALGREEDTDPGRRRPAAGRRTGKSAESRRDQRRSHK